MITRKRASKTSSASTPSRESSEHSKASATSVPPKSSPEPIQRPPSPPTSSAKPALPVDGDAEAARIQAQQNRVAVRIDRLILEIFTKDPQEWVPEAKALYDKVSRERKGIKALKVKLKASTEERVKEAQRIADIMKRLPIVDPYEHQSEFMVFKARRIARLLQKKPEMLEYLITQAQSSTYNKGWKNKVKLYEEIAEDPGMIIIGAEILCKIDEERGSLAEGSEFTFREMIDAMEWYMENNYEGICNVYEEYKDVPSKEMFIAERRGRSAAM